MLVKDTVIVTDSDFDLLTIKFADTILSVLLPNITLTMLLI